MSIEENKAIVRRFYEEMNQRNLAVFDEMVAADCVYHGMPPELPATRESVRQMMAATFAAFPDYEFIVEDVIAEGDRVAHLVTEVGTHQGAFMGIAATGKRVTSSAMYIVRLTGGMVVETWMVGDTLGFYQQLGALPAVNLVPA